MKAVILPTLQELEILLKADFDLGELYWRPRDESLFNSKSTWKMWNSRFAHKPAFSVIGISGYKQGKLEGKHFKSHRIIWKMHCGDDPINIDHINGIKTDNRIVNLRSVPQSKNNKNSALSTKNTSGQVGVTYNPQNGKWRCRIGYMNKDKHLGYFEKKSDAVAVRIKAEKFYDYHPNHGRTMRPDLFVQSEKQKQEIQEAMEV